MGFVYTDLNGYCVEKIYAAPATWASGAVVFRKCAESSEALDRVLREVCGRIWRRCFLQVFPRVGGDGFESGCD